MKAPRNWRAYCHSMPGCGTVRYRTSTVQYSTVQYLNFTQKAVHRHFHHTASPIPVSYLGRRTYSSSSPDILPSGEPEADPTPEVSERDEWNWDGSTHISTYRLSKIFVYIPISFLPYAKPTSWFPTVYVPVPRVRVLSTIPVLGAVSVRGDWQTGAPEKKNFVWQTRNLLCCYRYIHRTVHCRSQIRRAKGGAARLISRAQMIVGQSGTVPY